MSLKVDLVWSKHPCLICSLELRTLITFCLVWLVNDSLVLAQSAPPPGVTIPPNTPGTVEQTIPQPAPIPPPSVSPTPPPALEIPAPQPVQPPVVEPTNIRFRVDRVEVLGNTVLQAEIDQLTQNFLNRLRTEKRDATFDELIDLRSQITQLYIDRGYVTSGAFLPNNQDLTNGVIQIQVVEGELERIEIGGLRRLRQGYVRSRLERATRKPLNRNELVQALQLLQIDPLIQQVNAELRAGSSPGRNVLQVNLRESSPFTAGLIADNYQTSSIGSEQLSIVGSYANLLELGDRISAQYGITQGQNLYDLSYTVPVNALDGDVSLRYSNNNSRIIEEPFEPLGIRSEARTFSVGFRQPLFRSPNQEFALGLSFDLRRSQTFILDNEPFSFSEGAENGRSRVSVLRFSQDWLSRNRTSVLAVRSQFSFGLNLFDATINDTGTDGRFFSWLGQFQYLQQLSPRLVFLTRVNAQLTPDSLLSLERFSLGGIETVRGYGQNQLVADNGVSASAELRVSLSGDSNRIQLVPFVDAGHAWNNRTPNPEKATIASVGLGLRWLITPNLNLRLDYGIPLIQVENRGNSLQDNGFYFSLRYQPF